jgi:uncharacterized protein YbjT (DUF2867 family)
MRLLIVGASGGTGRQAVLSALAQGHAVRAWSHEPHEIAFMHPRLECCAGDAREAAVARRALAHIDAVVCALGSTDGVRPSSICSDGTQCIVDAMRERKVRRIVAVTSMGTTHKLGPVHNYVLDPLVLHNIYDDKRRQENILEASGLEWTVVRPGRLTNGRDRRDAVASLDGPLPGVLVSRAALARFLIEEVQRRRFIHMSPYYAEPAFAGWHRILTLGEGGKGVRFAQEV